MNVDRIENMTNGWFIGNFQPSLLKTQEVEVAFKSYIAGQKESAHHHKIATEFTLIASGEVKMNDQIFTQGDIITIYPNEVVAFEAITNATTVVVKLPSVSNDKYIQS
jgi:quercetin dioxygenase-like cupin family protein